MLMLMEILSNALDIYLGMIRGAMYTYIHYRGGKKFLDRNAKGVDRKKKRDIH